MTQPLLGWGLTPQALTNVTPFTYRDNATYIQLMQDVRDKVNEVISVVNLNAGSESTDVAAINAAYTALVAQWNATLATLDPTQVSALVTTLTANVTTALNNAATALTTATSASDAVTALNATLTAALAAETAARSSAITSAVLVETTARTTADDTEAATRAAADATEASTRAAADAAFMPSPSPSWCTRVKHFDPLTGAYNLNPQTLSKFRTARSAAIAGAGQLHVSVLGDSITMRPDDTSYAYLTAWPGRMRDRMIHNLGLNSCGAGIMGLWDLFGGWNFTNFAAFPHLSWILTDGSLTKWSGSGVYTNNGVRLQSGNNPWTLIQINPVGGQMVDEFWIYMQGSSSDTFVDITDGTTTYSYQIPAYYGASVVTPRAGYTAVGLESGYGQGDVPSVNGGMRVAKLVVPAQNNWTAKVQSDAYPKFTIMTMFESKLSTGNFRVSNLAQGGVDLTSMMNANTFDAGMSQGLDTPSANLAIIALGMNDFQEHESVATFKSNLTTVVQRQRFNGPTLTNGSGRGANGDVLLVVTPQPDYTNIPVDHVEMPPLSDFWRAMYEVADEQNVALVDEAWRWTDYNTSVGMYNAGSPIHPGVIGHADIGTTIGDLLSTV